MHAAGAPSKLRSSSSTASTRIMGNTPSDPESGATMMRQPSLAEKRPSASSQPPLVEKKSRQDPIQIDISDSPASRTRSNLGKQAVQSIQQAQLERSRDIEQAAAAAANEQTQLELERNNHCVVKDC